MKQTPLIPFKFLFIEGLGNRLAFSMKASYDKLRGKPNVNAAEVNAMRAQIKRDTEEYQKLKKYVDDLRNTRDGLSQALSAAIKRENRFLEKQLRGHLKNADSKLIQYRNRKEKLNKEIKEKIGHVHSLMGDNEGWNR